MLLIKLTRQEEREVFTWIGWEGLVKRVIAKDIRITSKACRDMIPEAYKFVLKAILVVKE